MFLASADPYVEAYRSMREGTLYLFIAWILVGIGLSLMVFSLLLRGSLLLVDKGPRAVLGVFPGGLVVAALMTLVGAIMALIGLWGKFLPGVKKLASVNPEFSTASTLVNTGLFWGLVLILVGVPLLIFLVGGFLILVGYILLVLGWIGMLILCLKLSDLEKNSLYLVAGILFILSIFLSILDFVAWILLYVALGDSISKRMRAPPTPTPTTLLPPV